jgi:alpha-tubulin suppressor-like RCC1 family protein
MSGTIVNPKDFVAGANHALIIDANDKVWVIGANANGQLGQGNLTAPAAATAIPRSVSYSGTQIEAKRVFAGTDSSYAVLADGTVLAWGLNTSGQLGINNLTTQQTPTFMLDEYAENKFEDALVINAGIDATHTMIIDTLGRVHTIGSNDATNKSGDYKTTILTKSKPVEIYRESIQSTELVHRISINESKNLNVYLKKGLNIYEDNKLSLGTLTYFSSDTNIVTVTSSRSYPGSSERSCIHYSKR